jgi:chromosome segregation ATPase
VSNANAGLENCQMNLALLDQRLKDLEAKFAAKGQTHSAMVVSSPDLETLYKILSEYAKKSEFGDYTLKSERDDIVNRLARLEKKVETNVARIDKWEPEWTNIQYLMDTMPTKADKSELEEAIERIKSIIGSLSGNSDAVTAAFDSSELKDAIKKLQSDVLNLQKSTHDNTIGLARLQGEFSATQKQALQTASDLSKLTVRVDKLEDLLKQMQRLVNDMQVRLA